MNESLSSSANEHGIAGSQRDTTKLIIDLVRAITQAGDYNKAMPRVLEMLSTIIVADRLYLMEQQGRLDGRVFERCAEGVPPRMSALKGVNDQTMAEFVGSFEGCDIIYGRTLEEVGFKDPRYIAFFKHLGIHSELIVPLRENGRFVGCLGADNYSLVEDIDVDHVLKTIAPIMATTISNYQLLEELKWSGVHDALTGLLNRRGIDDAVDEYLAANSQAPLALALIDIDNFKVVNDVYGHAAGDKALMALASTLKEEFVTDAIIGRNGGDELLVMFINEAVGRVDELIAGLSRRNLTYESGDKTLHFTISIGYTSYPDQAQSLSAAYNQADTALYAVKLAGKSAAIRYSPDLELQRRSQLGFTPHNIAESIPGAILVHRAYSDGEILFANSEMVELLGCDDLADFMEHTKGDYRNIMHPDDKEAVHEHAESQIWPTGVGAKFFVDYRLITKQGTVRDVAVNGRLLEIPDVGKAFYVLFIDREEHASHHV